MSYRSIAFVGLLVLVITLQQISSAQLPTPPQQPATGPGGKQAAHAGVIKNRYREGAREYWIYEPDKPKPSGAPVIIFLNPLYYGAWIDHIVRRGERSYLSAIPVEHTDAA